jgi:LysR family transcriptional regulator, low CO2-responsive transcriptional regulator
MRGALDLDHLAAFLAVLETRNFRAAARRLGHAQPTVSQHVKRLETALGTPLVERRSDGCRPTPAGNLFRPYAENLLRLAERARAALAGERRLVIGAATNIAVYMLQPAIRAFENAAEGVAVDLTIGRNPEIVARLEDGVLDLALLEWWDGRPGFTALPWREEELVVILAPDHRWAGRHAITIAELAGAPLIGGEPGTGTGRVLAEALRRSGVTLEVTRSLGSTEAVKRAVQAGNGVSIVLASTVLQEVSTGQLAALSIAGASLRKTLFAVFRARLSEEAPACRFLARLVRLGEENGDATCRAR